MMIVKKNFRQKKNKTTIFDSHIQNKSMMMMIIKKKKFQTQSVVKLLSSSLDDNERRTKIFNEKKFIVIDEFGHLFGCSSLSLVSFFLLLQ